MARLTSITTKRGDRGETGLGDGSRVPKTHPRIDTLGEVDELNAVLGMVLLQPVEQPYADWLRQIQNDLFDLGGDLCFPPEPGAEVRAGLLAGSHVQRLDDWLDQLHPLLTPLENFILPGGGPVSAPLHWARTVCRRAERSTLELHASEPVPEVILQYLNRLSDLLFQLARITEHPDHPTPLWKPTPPTHDGSTPGI